LEVLEKLHVMLMCSYYERYLKAVERQIPKLLLKSAQSPEATQSPDEAAEVWSAHAGGDMAEAGGGAAPLAVASTAEAVGTAETTSPTEAAAVAAPELCWQPARSSFLLHREMGLFKQITQKLLGRFVGGKACVHTTRQGLDAG
jgi:hypothetical protein